MTTTAAQHEILDRLDRLTPEQQREVEDFVEFLSQRLPRPNRTHLSGGWLGALGDLRNQTTGVELQHEANQLRNSGTKIS